MQRDTIVYFGIIQYEYNNAMCQHAAGIEMMIKALGYRAITIGVSPRVRPGRYDKRTDNSYIINYPQSIRESIRECFSANDLIAVMDDIVVNRIKTFIMADYRYLPMLKMEKYCKKNGIFFAVDVMDRFMSENTITSKIKKIDSELRMRFLYPKVERRIHICHAYNALLGKGKHVAVIPGVGKNSHNELKTPKLQNETIKLVFLGRPGLRCEKEKLDWIIKAIHTEKLIDSFELVLAGFDGKKFSDKNEKLRQYLSDNVIFKGRLKHEECIELLQRADFSLVIRPDTLLSQYGFSTKITESFGYGIPVLATDTSDNRLYIDYGKNGFVCGSSFEEVKEMLKMIAKLSRQDINEMKQYCCNNNPLEYTHYTKLFKSVILDN